MTVLQKLLFLALLLVVAQSPVFGQCQNWNELPALQKEEAENAHVLYRSYVRDKTVDDLKNLDQETFKIAFNNWRKAYDLAPAADGQRPSHYADGRLILKAVMQKETDPAKKKEYADQIIRLYDEQIECYENAGYLLGRKGYDMLTMPRDVPGYGFNTNTLTTFKEALDKGGNATEYFILEPIAQLLVYLYRDAKQIDKEEAREIYLEMEAIADHNIENNDRYGEYYNSAKLRVENQFKPVVDEVFDCDYFKRKLIPLFEENRDSLDIIRYVFQKLRLQGCDSTDAEVVRVRTAYEELATTINAQLEVERRAKNPGYDASQLQKEGKYEEAVARYREAIESSEDEEAKAQFYYSIAFIQTWQFDQLQSARSNALRAAERKSDWGRPYLLIGDIYAKASRSCGSDGYSRGLAILAALEKYRYARSVDPSLEDDVNERIRNYSASIPPKEEAFMRGTQGQTVAVPCWIPERVTLPTYN